MNENGTLPMLFDFYPELEKKIKWFGLGSFPTPVQPLDALEFKKLWIKRDDLTSPVYGGNKIRKLEFILGEVKKRNKKSIVTFGGIGTNHGLATAIFCQKLNLACTLLLFNQPVTENVKQNLRLFFKYGARIIYKGPLWKTVFTYYISQRLQTPFSYFLFAGGSNIHGTLGFVNAVFELKSQIASGLMPEPDYIFAPVGSGGTVAGLALGTQLAGLKTRVIGIRVTASHLGPFPACTAETVRRLMVKVFKYLKNRSRHIPRVNIAAPEIIGSYLGGGYGHPTRAGKAAADLLKGEENIILDPCYTAKAFAAVLDYCRHNKKNSGHLLYWHTYNGVDLTSQAQEIDIRKLPRVIRKILAGNEST